MLLLCPPDWLRARLDDLASLHSGSTPSRAVPGYWNGDIPWVTPSELTRLSTKYLTATEDRITAAGQASCAASLVPEDSLLVTTRATLGASAMAAMPVTTNQGFRSLVFGDRGDPHFYYHLSALLKPELLRRASGTTFMEISGREFGSIEVPLPTLPEQRRIAEILDTLDETILRTEQLIAKLQQIRQGLIHDLLTRGIDDNGELRDPERHPGQFDEHLVLGRIPREWGVDGLEAFGAPDRPFIKTGPFGSSLKGEHWVERGVPVITIGALGEGEFLHQELLHVSSSTADRLSAYAVRPGDLVFSRVADVGRSVVVQDAQDGWIMSSNLMWIAVDSTRALPDYLWLNLSGNHAIRAQVRRSVNAGGREVANGTVLRSLRFAWPDIAEQRRIVRVVASHHERWHQEFEFLAKLRHMKAGLMDDLLTGRVRVPVDEGA